MTRRFRSATLHEGLLRAPTRSFLQALGQDDDEIARPHVGVFHTGGEMSPCNLNLRDQAQHAKTGIYAAGGMPHECPVVSVSDGLSIAHAGMRFSLVSRERKCPGNAEPPCTNTLGTLQRTMPNMSPGRFLSQAPMAKMPSH